MKTEVSSAPIAPECICTEKCTAQTKNESCPVCKDLTDDFSACDPIPETSDLTVTVTAPSGWTADGSPYTVDGTTKTATVTLTSNTKGELTPARKLTITDGTGWTASTATFTNGTGDSTNGTAAKFTFVVTVTGSASVTIPADALTVADDNGSDPAPTTFDVTVAAPSGWTASTEKLTAVDATTGKTHTLTSSTLGAKDYTVTAGAVDGLTITSEVAPGKDWVITETAVDLSSANDLEAKKSALKAAITNGSGVVGLVTNKTTPTEVLNADDIDALTDQTIAQEYYTCTQEATATVITVTVKATKAAAIAADTLTIAAKDANT